MHILCRPTRTIPEVAVQLWYNVGSKDEESGQRGMAHLIEHMIFKGTKRLSEVDIDLITCKLSGYTNAFTSNDYTAYVFKLPSNVWHESLKILSDCMQNARFDEQMLNSELHTVVQELKLYKDEYQEVLIERMMAGIFPQHPYHHPIIGYKQDLLNLDRDRLFSFYKKHYHPASATLVVVGDVKKDEVFEFAEKEFGGIKSPENYEKKKNFFLDGIYNVEVKLPREVDNPWAFYAFAIPGTCSGKAHLFDMITILLGQGRSSRLYEKVVNEAKLATSVGCFSYDLFEKGLFCIYVQPTTLDALSRIEKIVGDELTKLADTKIEEWEFHCVKKKCEMRYVSLFESSERQAEMIGHSFLATGDVRYVDRYMENLGKTRRLDLCREIKEYIQPSLRHAGYLVPSGDQEKALWQKSQEESDVLDQKILKSRPRKSKVEGPKSAKNFEEKDLPEFRYPSPKTFILDNGLEVIYHHRSAVPKISMILGLKADYLHEPEELGGMSTFMSRLLLEGTKKYSASELSRYLESEGIYVSMSSGIVSLEFLSKDFSKALEILDHIITEPAFKKDSIEKVRRRMVMELDEFWNSPSSFVDLLARQAIYKGHPYSKMSLGHKECVEKFNRDQIVDFYNEYLSPQEAALVIVGDLEKHDEESLTRLIKKHLGDWKGKQIQDLVFPELSYDKPRIIHHKINRDQTVLALAAPSVSRLDNNYDSLAVLDFVLTGAGISSTSRLYQLREQTGIFYTAGGSLVYGAGRAPGMVFLKTIVSLDKVSQAEKLIRKTVKDLQDNGISNVELVLAVRALMTASVRVFESNARIARTFLYLKRCGMNLDLFDKRGALLSILKIDAVNKVARHYCRENFLSTITVGRKNG
jgi:zinc protease